MAGESGAFEVLSVEVWSISMGSRCSGNWKIIDLGMWTQVAWTGALLSFSKSLLYYPFFRGDSLLPGEAFVALGCAGPEEHQHLQV